MSEPPLKKKRTILDFFSGKGNKKSRGEGKKVDVMASAANAVDKNSSSGAKTKVTDDEVPGTSAADTHVEETIVINDFDSEDTLKDIPTKKPSQCKAGSQAWKGIPLKILDKLTDMDENLGPLHGTDNHRVLFKTPFKYDGVKPPTPFPTYKDKWDTNYVRMPCSNLSEYPTTGKDGGPKVLRRWDMIQEALLADIPGPYELEEKILSYNSRYFGKWNFNVLHSFFVENIDNAERNHFFNDTLKKMATLALQLPHLCTAPIPLLKCNRNFSVTLSQQQIACLLANAFFCTFPRRNAKSRTSEYIRYPNINFNSLFMGQPSYVKFEKLRCIIHYFNRIFKKMPCGTVTFTRQCIPQDKMPNWENDDTPLRGLHVSSEGTIEDDGLGLLQADFANMYLGGGVLGNGCVQEEIRFLICPEMIVSRLFTECLNKNECLLMRGCERFSNYDGYAAKFEWKENYIDTTPRDSWGRIKCEVTAIDALVIHDFRSQFQVATVKRELNKAYCGFAYLGKKTTDTLPAVCTGNWGCGAFGGDKQLKALIQLMAAAKAGRDLCYFTFDDEGLRDQIFAIHKYLTSDNMLRIGEIMAMLGLYYSDVVKHSSGKYVKHELFEYIKVIFSVNSGRNKLSKTVPHNPGHVQTRHGHGRLSYTYPGHHNTRSRPHNQGHGHHVGSRLWNEF
ncbi:poly(ADP-ribose) glycohydrolase-like isoform X2 [Ruditapes philippinarum]|uniref:poly(ADP-ribose) glycohydrolase-like isoform X2 n=1 Tax=Ruditapes philippinarum TaxID=129788 RepID=UPI00295C307B|nr:poly(ADP-ribose) glycohydrolase-like isoform X2 [Ruditapes philippinarum]